MLSRDPQKDPAAGCGTNPPASALRCPHALLLPPPLPRLAVVAAAAAVPTTVASCSAATAAAPSSTQAVGRVGGAGPSCCSRCLRAMGFPCLSVVVWCSEA